MAGTTSGVIFNKRGENHNMRLFKGKTVDFSLVWGGGSPIDVTGYDARMKIKSAPGGTEIASFTVANSRVTIGTTNGLITFSMSATDSAALTAGDYQYDIEVINAAGKVYLAMSGDCTVEGEITA